MRILFLIGSGSFIGGIFRYSLSQFIQSKFLSAFPYGTLGVNVLGCLAMGIVFAWSERINMIPEWRLFLATGLLGGFTTFSAFSNETFSLIRDGQLWYAATYITASILLGVLATFMGYALLKLI